MGDTGETLNNIDKTINKMCDYTQTVTSRLIERNCIGDSDYVKMINALAGLIEARNGWSHKIEIGVVNRQLQI